MSARQLALATLLGTTLFSGAAAADDELSEAQTSYTGAVMLEGEVDVDFGQVSLGDLGLDGQSTYAYFTGNTLYFGGEDAEGNTVNAIAEFFWFESSIDRGSDFYVGVIKARTTPNVADGWYLEVDDTDPVLAVRAEADTSDGVGAFRWDWSVPFENYGMDSYGEVTLQTEYGIGGSAEGSAMYAKKYDEDGAQAEVDVQTKGYVNSEYKISTQYQVTLYRWNMNVSGSAAAMDWSMTLENSDRDEQSAYHEYFLVMQVDEGETFTIDRIDVGGFINGWYWWDATQLGVAIEGVTLSPPPFEPEDEEDEDTGDGGEDTGDGGGSVDTGDAGEDTGAVTDTGSDEPDEGEGELTFGGDGDGSDADDVKVSLCATGATAAPVGALWVLAGFVALGRRRRHIG